MDSATDMNMDFQEGSASVLPSPPHLLPQKTEGQSQGMLLNPTNDPFAATSIPGNVPVSDGRFREISVKVHVRRPDKDNWAYLGRGMVCREVFGRGSRIVVRSLSGRQVMAAFNEGSPIQADKRGNFVVVSCVDNGRVISWSLNALNNSETLRLLAVIETSCHSCGRHALTDPPNPHNIHRRRIARVIKEDRKKRHRRRRDQDAMIQMFAQTGLGAGGGGTSGTSSEEENIQDAMHDH